MIKIPKVYNNITKNKKSVFTNIKYREFDNFGQVTGYYSKFCEHFHRIGQYVLVVHSPASDKHGFHIQIPSVLCWRHLGDLCREVLGRWECHCLRSYDETVHWILEMLQAWLQPYHPQTHRRWSPCLCHLQKRQCSAVPTAGQVWYPRVRSSPKHRRHRNRNIQKCWGDSW